MLDTGAPDDGVDELAIYGFDNLDRGFNGYVPGTPTRNADRRHLPAARVEVHRHRGARTAVDAGGRRADLHVADRERRPTRPSSRCCTATAPDGGLGLLPRPRRRQRAERRRPADQLRRRAERPAQRLRPRRQRRLLRRRQQRDHDARRRRRQRQLPDRPDLRHQARRRPRARCCRTTSSRSLDRDDARLAEPGHARAAGRHGGTGNDEFIVYSNQAELRLEGDDDNDLFIVRAFALAAVCDTERRRRRRLRLRRRRPRRRPGHGRLPERLEQRRRLQRRRRTARWPTGVRQGQQRRRRLQQRRRHRRRATTTATRSGRTTSSRSTPTASRAPMIGLGFSTGRPLDIRAGGGEDEVQYNVNAPVSVDGGTGFDKLVVLGTEFADDIVITASGIFGAGLNVRYANVEVVEVDGLEGDDEFFVQSTAFGVAYRVIGGLGSDTINVTGDVTEDIVTRELEGLSGAVDHRVTLRRRPALRRPAGRRHRLQPRHARQRQGRSSTTRAPRARRCARAARPAVPDDRLLHRVARRPARPPTVYVTVSAARSPQEEADDAFANPERPAPTRSRRQGRHDLALHRRRPAPATATTPSDFQRFKCVNGVLVDENNRALVLTFTAANWRRMRAEGLRATRSTTRAPRATASSSSSTATSPHDDALRRASRSATSRSSLRDNDTPGVYVTEVDAAARTTEDRRTLVIEGSHVRRATTPAATTSCWSQLAKAPAAGDTIRVKLVLDAESQQAISLTRRAARGRAASTPIRRRARTYYTIDFNGTQLGHRRCASSVDGARRRRARGPADRGRSASHARRRATVDADQRDYVVPEPPLRHRPHRRRGDRRRDRRRGRDRERRRHARRQVRQRRLHGPGRHRRLHDPADQAAATATVDVARSSPTAWPTSQSINGVAITPAGYRDDRRLRPDPAVPRQPDGRRRRAARSPAPTAATSAASSTRASRAGQLIRIGGAGAATTATSTIRRRGHRRRARRSTRRRCRRRPCTGVDDQPPDARGHVEVGRRRRSSSRLRPAAGRSSAPDAVELARRRLPRGPVGRGLPTRRHVHRRAALQDRDHPRRQRDEGREARVHARDGDLAALADGSLLDVHGRRAIAAVATLHATTELVQASSRSSSSPTSTTTVPISRQGVKVFPVSTHVLSKLRGPLAVEGGVTGADRSLAARPQAAGREGRPAVRDRHAAARVQADRRPEHLQRRQPGRTAPAR